MEDSQDTRKLWTMLLFAAWCGAFIMSFVAFSMTEPTGDGFVRGMNRVGRLLGWQGVAGVLAVLTWGVGRRLEPGSGARKLAAFPVLVAVVLVLALVGLLIWARFSG